MRGIYSGGVLVALEELGLSSVFDKIFGESAGAINASYFLAGQGSFGIRIYLDHLSSLKFVNPFRVGSMLNLDYVVDRVMKEIKPLDVDRVLASPTDLFVAVTSAVDGHSRLVDAKREGIPLLTLLKATGAIVPLYNHAVEIAGQPYVDGGIANPIPVHSAIQAGCTHILVLLTQPLSFRSVGYNRFQRYCLSPLFKKWPNKFVDSFYLRQSRRYNETRDLAMGRTVVKEGVHIAVIAPTPDSPLLSRATISRRRLLAAQEDAEHRTREIFAELSQGRSAASSG